jgi:hypothetical protein
MHASEVTCGVVAFVIPLPGLACLTVGQERLIGRSVDGHPDFTCLFVDTVGMTSELMLTAEAIGIVRADGTL